MKKLLVVVCYLGLIGMLLVGCGGNSSDTTTTASSISTSTSTSTTTSTSASTTTSITTTSTTTTSVSTSTTTTNVGNLEVAKAVSIVGVGSSVGGSSTIMGGLSANALASSAIKSFSASPPPFFLYSSDIMNGPLSVEGYIPVTSESTAGGIAVAFRMKNQIGEIIAGNLLANKKIAKIGNYSTYGVLLALMEAQPPVDFTTAFIAWVMACSIEGEATYVGSNFMQITSEGEYMCWVSTYSTMEAMIRQTYSIPGWLHLVTPEAGVNDALGAIDSRTTFSGFVTGEITVPIAVDPVRTAPLPGTYEATSTLTFEGGILATTASLTFINLDSGVEFVSCNLRGVSSPGNERFSISMDPNTLIGSGILSSEAAATSGTFEAVSTGGTYYPVSGETQTFNF